MWPVLRIVLMMLLLGDRGPGWRFAAVMSLVVFCLLIYSVVR
jgi:hypothetical protein